MRPKVKLASRLATIVGLLALLLALGLGTASAQGTTHVVKAGETLATIAQAYGTSVKAIVNAAQERNLLLLSCGTYDNTIRWIPPLNVTSEQINDGLKIFGDSLKATLG